MSPSRSDVLTSCKCGGTMSIAIVEYLLDRQQHTFICEQCAGVGQFTFAAPSIAPECD